MEIFQVVMLATLTLTITVTHGSAHIWPTACGSGWFGHKCQYQCHCAGSADCDSVNGSCATGCDPAWFGPACQYASMNYTASPNPRQAANMDWLTDNDDISCNSEKSLTAVRVELQSPIPLTWIRIVVKDSASLYEVTLTYRENGQDMPCTDQGIVQVNENTGDMNCSTPRVVSRLDLTGPGVKSLCSLYVSGGRNVAIKQHTEQSSTYQTMDAYKAVDGEIDKPSDFDSQKATCTHTSEKATGTGSWTLSFSQPVSVTRFLLYNRRDPYHPTCCEDRLRSFTLTADSDPSRPDPYTYKDPGGPAQDVYTVVPATRISFPVEEVRIRARDNNFKNVSILTLCEVVVFGESLCPPGKFGLGCERQCNCEGHGEICFVHSGGCLSGCAHGYTGQDCWAKIDEVDLGCTGQVVPVSTLVLRQEEEGEEFWRLIIVGSMVVAQGILLIVTAVLLWWRLRTLSVSGRDQKENSATHWELVTS